MNSKKITGMLLTVYLLALGWIILFKLQLDFTMITSMNFRGVNLIPFQGSAVVNGQIDLSEIFKNCLIFIPYGILISSLLKDRSFLERLTPIFLTSLLFEIAQFAFAIGASDITDLISNTLGGAIGIGAFLLLEKWLGKKVYKTINIISAIAAIGLIGFITLVLLMNIN